MEKPSPEVIIYTDGACLGNPGPGGYGVVLISGPHRKEISGGDPNTTNNRMELQAVIMGLKALKRPSRVTVYSDSKYVVQMVEEGWLERWRMNGWMRNKKEEAKNVDQLKILHSLLKTHQVRMVWVKGHAETKENNRCDEMAVREAEIQKKAAAV